MPAKKSSSVSSTKPLHRKSIVVIQFTIAIVLIIRTFIMTRQLNYIGNKELGFNKQYIISLPINQGFRENFESFKKGLPFSLVTYP